MVIVVSDEVLNSKGFITANAGLDTSLFVKNPVMFWKHDRERPPIGTWKNLRILNGQWVAEPVVDVEGGDFEKMIAGKLEREVIRASSIGIIPLEGEIINGEKWVTKALLVEISLTDIPSNGNAITLYRKDKVSGKLVKLAFEDLEELNFFETNDDTLMTKEEKQKFEALEKQFGGFQKTIETLADENKVLKAELEEVKKAKAQQDKKEGEKDDKASEALKKELLAMQEKITELSNERVSVNDLVSAFKSGSFQAQQSSEREGWTLSDWQKNDPKNLALMRDAEPEKFQGLLANLRK